MQSQAVSNANAHIHSAERATIAADKAAEYIQASKEYIRAAENVSDPVLRSAFIYLSTNAALSAASTLPVQSAAEKASTSKKTQPNKEEASSILYNQRLIAEGHRARPTGVRSIPHAARPTPAAIINDLLVLESKLADIGIMRDVNSDELWRQAAHAVKRQQQAQSLSSDLGESFMLLSNYGGAVPTLRGGGGAAYNINNNNNINDNNQSAAYASKAWDAFTAVLAPVAAAVAPSASSLTTALSTATAAATAAAGAAAARRSSFGGGKGTGSGRSESEGGRGMGRATLILPSTVAADSTQLEKDKEPALQQKIKHSQTDQRENTAPPTLTWNDQSVFLDIRGEGGGGPRSGSAAASSNANDDRNDKNGPPSQPRPSARTRSGLDSANLSSSTTYTPDVIHKLLKTVKTLTEENAPLVRQGAEFQRAAKEVQRVQEEVDLFKRDYFDRFQRLKQLLETYSKTFRRSDNPALLYASRRGLDALDLSASSHRAQQQRIILEQSQLLNGSATASGRAGFKESKSGNAIKSSSQSFNHLGKTISSSTSDTGQLSDANNGNLTTSAISRTNHLTEKLAAYKAEFLKQEKFIKALLAKLEETRARSKQKDIQLKRYEEQLQYLQRQSYLVSHGANDTANANASTSASAAVDDSSIAGAFVVDPQLQSQSQVRQQQQQRSELNNFSAIVSSPNRKNRSGGGSSSISTTIASATSHTNSYSLAHSPVRNTRGNLHSSSPHSHLHSHMIPRNSKAGSTATLEALFGSSAPPASAASASSNSSSSSSSGSSMTVGPTYHSGAVKNSSGGTSGGTAAAGQNSTSTK